MDGVSLYDVSLIFSVIAFIASMFSLAQTLHLSLTMTYRDAFRESWNANDEEVKEEVAAWK